MASQKISVIILGDGAVGKTSLLKMYDEKKFQPAHMATLGLDYISKTYNPKDGGKSCAVKIWDTAGQERFRTLTHSFYKQGHGIIIGFAVNDIGTFQSVQTWLNSIKEHADPNVIKILVGNKCDLEGERKVSYEEANKLAQENNMHYYDTSAKNDMNIDAFMDDLIGQVHE
jgi:small GTP-binding protein